MSAISLRDVSVVLGGAPVLEAATLDLDARRIAVIGENGSGKSTLARVIGGLITPTTGAVRIHGVDAVRDVRALRRKTAVVFSNPDAQIIMPTVTEDVAFSLRQEKLPRTELAQRVDTALADFGLSELADRSAHELSGGQKQLLALCGAFVRQPELVIADEPTALLDARNARRVAAHLLERAGHRLVLVTHDLALAARCDVAVLVAGGRIATTGTPDEVIAAYERTLVC